MPSHKTKKMPSLKLAPSFMGKRIPKPFKDRDGDLTPDIIDCSPNNPRKQGPRWDAFKEKVSGAVSSVGEKYKEYKAAAPERRQEQEERMEHRVKMQEHKEKLSTSKSRMLKSRIEVGTARVKMMGERQKAMAQMPSIAGGFGGMGARQSAPQRLSPMTSMPTGFGIGGTQPQVRKKRRIRKKAKKSGYVIVDGKAYKRA